MSCCAPASWDWLNAKLHFSKQAGSRLGRSQRMELIMDAISQQREEFLASAAVLRVNLRGQEHDFRYPDNVYMRNVVLGIFQGNEYPLVRLPGYEPSTILDVGANVGATALYFHHAYPRAK